MDSSAIQMVNENDMDMFNASHLISGHQRPSLDCNDRDSDFYLEACNGSSLEKQVLKINPALGLTPLCTPAGILTTPPLSPQTPKT